MTLGGRYFDSISSVEQ